SCWKLAVTAVLACAAGFAFAAPNPVSGPKPADGGFQTAAAHAMLIDADSGTVLFEKAADDLIPPASLSKLMTAELVFNLIKQDKLNASTEFIVSTNAWRRGGAPRARRACSSRSTARYRWTIFCTASSSNPRTTPASRWRRASRAPSPNLPR